MARLALLTALVLAGSSAGAGAVTLPSIYVDYSDACTFTMRADGGIALASATAPGPTLPPGLYQLVLTAPKNAPSCPMDFKLTGPGVQLEWDFGGEALDAMATETLQPSATYVATDVANQARGYVVFSTSASGSSSSLATQVPSTATGKGETLPGVVGSDVVPSRGAATATVSGAGRLTLTYRGRRVRSLASGRYRLAVTDASRTAGVAIATGTRRKPLTGVAFVGRKTATIVLTARSSVAVVR